MRDGHLMVFGAPPAQPAETSNIDFAHPVWISNAAPYSPPRVADARVVLNTTTHVAKQSAPSFDDPVIAGGLTHFCLIN